MPGDRRAVPGVHIGPITRVVRDYDEAIAFFTGVLGFQPREDTPPPDGRRRDRIEPV